MYCENCGMVVSDNSNFCSNCGAKVKKPILKCSKWIFSKWPILKWIVLATDLSIYLSIYIVQFLEWPITQCDLCSCHIDFFEISTFWKALKTEHRYSGAEFVEYSVWICCWPLASCVVFSYKFRAVLCLFGECNTISWRVSTECYFWPSSCNAYTREKGCFWDSHLRIIAFNAKKKHGNSPIQQHKHTWSSNPFCVL